jgi:hypothetical protein
MSARHDDDDRHRRLAELQSGAALALLVALKKAR